MIATSDKHVVIRILCIAFVVLAAAMLSLLPVESAVAQVPNNALDDILAPFAGLQQLGANVLRLAEGIFWSLLLLELVVSGFSLFWTGSDFNAFGRWIVERFLIFAVALFMFDNGAVIGNIIRATFIDLGVSLRGVYPTPTDVVERGITIASQLQSSVSFWTGAGAIPILIAALLLSLIFAAIAANMAVLLCEIYIVSVAGIFLLGFAGSSWTREYAFGYFRYLIGFGFKLAAMQVLVGVGLVTIDGWLVNITAADIQNTGLLTLISTVLIFYTLTKTVPSAAAEMVHGRINGGFGGVSGSGASIISNMRSTSNNLSSVASTMKGAAKSMGTTASAMKAASQAAKAGGATGAAVVSGAAANIGSAAKQEASKSMQGIRGPGSMGQRINHNLHQRSKSGNR